MPGVQEFSQQVRSIIDVVIRFARARKREEASISFGALLILGGVYLASGLEKVGLKEFFAWWHGEAIVRGLLIAAGIGFVLYGGYKIFRLVYVPPLPPPPERPSAIKGPMAFTEADGELFRKLGRESELQKLLGLALDDQVLLIVIRGASGAGKTSLLRAGLKHILGDRAIFHYWEAVPTEPDKGLLRAIQEKWPEGAAKPATLEELVNPAETLGRQAHVFVLDQFEQLRGNRKMFALLRRILRESKPPHRITWVIAFRREFSADWLDFISPEIERGIRPPQDVSLRLFTAEQAREVIGQLVNESNLKDSIEQSVINNLVEAATVEGEVSPVDIGIGLLVLAELHERQSGQTITIRDYQFAGGAEGLLTQYISRCLDLFPKEHQEAILKAMLALRDPETNQRLAEGLTVDELAAESGAEARLLKTQLDRLSHRDTRLLETVTPTDGSPTRYRLPHERLVPALYRLTGKLLAEVDQAKLKFQNAFQAWKTNDKRRHYLLKAKELKLVERYESQIPWGNDEQEKKGFLRRSKHRSVAFQVGVMTMVLCLSGALWWGWQRKLRSEGQSYLAGIGYPPELYDWQDELNSLTLYEPLSLAMFSWLHSDSIEELSVEAESSSTSIEGLTSLANCNSLKKLTLNLGKSSVSDLEPLTKLSNLAELDLRLESSKVNDLVALSRMSNLKQLQLSLGGQVKTLEPLTKMGSLTHLTLVVPGGVAKDLEPLSRSNSLKDLSLVLMGLQVDDLNLDFKKLGNLRRLQLYLVEYQPNNQNKTLDALSQLSSQTQLHLQLAGYQSENLKLLPTIRNLSQLDIDLRYVEAQEWQVLARLSEQTKLALTLSYSKFEDMELLSRLNNRVELTLSQPENWRELNVLEPLSKKSNFEQLTLDLSSNPENKLAPLAKFDRIKLLNLNLQFNNVEDLSPLTKLSNLTKLMLDLGNSDIGDWESLSNLQAQVELAIVLTSREANYLEYLPKLNNLKQLTLGMRNVDVIDWNFLPRLTHLKSLSIWGTTPEQRRSLRKIPASLRELKF